MDRRHHKVVELPKRVTIIISLRADEWDWDDRDAHLLLHEHLGVLREICDSYVNELIPEYTPRSVYSEPHLWNMSGELWLHIGLVPKLSFLPMSAYKEFEKRLMSRSDLATLAETIVTYLIREWESARWTKVEISLDDSRRTISETNT
jgi:hypothetical protein